MEKKTSQKRINKSSTHYKGNDNTVNCILKEIGDLKKQLITIKSKKNINIQHHFGEEDTKRQSKQGGKLIGEKGFRDTIKGANVEFIQRDKQNEKGCTCQCHNGTKMHYQSSRKQNIKIDLFAITAPRSRQIKLKLNIQLNKMKQILQRMYRQNYKYQLIQLIVAQLNATNAYINSTFKQYQYQFIGKKSAFQEMKVQLSEVTGRMIKLSQKHSTQKHANSAHIEQIAELRRHLSYYMQLMQDNKEQAEKCSKDYSQLELYLKQLQHSNQLTKKQLKLSEQKKQQFLTKIKQLEQQTVRDNKEHMIMQNDVHLLKVENEKSKEKRKQLERAYEKVVEQLRVLSSNTRTKQFNQSRKQDQNRQLRSTIYNIKNQKQNINGELVNKGLQNQKLWKENKRVINCLQEKQKIILQLQEYVKQLKKDMQKQNKENKKLNQRLTSCQMEIDNLVEEVSELEKANERYKNQHFRNKALQKSGSNQRHQKHAGSHNKNGGVSQSTDKKILPKNANNGSHGKNKQKILGEIQQLIQKHKKSSDSEVWEEEEN